MRESRQFFDGVTTAILAARAAERNLKTFCKENGFSFPGDTSPGKAAGSPEQAAEYRRLLNELVSASEKETALTEKALQLIDGLPKKTQKVIIYHSLKIGEDGKQMPFAAISRLLFPNSSYKTASDHYCIAMKRIDEKQKSNGGAESGTLLSSE